MVGKPVWQTMLQYNLQLYKDSKTAEVFAQTGKLWEFYCPFGNNPTMLHRKPDKRNRPNVPSDTYLGHCPLIAIAEIWQAAHN